MLVIVNGAPREIPSGSSVAELLLDLELEVRGLAVEVNGQLVPRDSLSDWELKAQDEIEIVTLAGGG